MPRLTLPALAPLRDRMLAAWDTPARKPRVIAALWAVGLLLGLGVGLVLDRPGTLAWLGWGALGTLALGLALFAQPLLEEPAPPRPPPPIPPLLDLVALPGRAFWMGSNPAKDAEIEDWAKGWAKFSGGTLEDAIKQWRDWQRDEQPRHRVQVAAFRIARTPVTRGQWRAVLAGAPAPTLAAVPSRWAAAKADDELPVTDLDWTEALAFCNALSVREGLTPCYRPDAAGDWHWDQAADGYRLPTEAEWEYACRAGTDTWWFWGDQSKGADAHAWYTANAKDKLQPVGRKRPNRFKLHDMAGLVWEWCWDRYGPYPDDDKTGDKATKRDRAIDNPSGAVTGDTRVVRGGSFDGPPGFLRSAGRLGDRPFGWAGRLGLRCVRSVPRQQ